MKHIFKFVLLTIVSLFLVACANGKATQETSTESQLTARLVVTIDTNKIDEKVTFSKGDTIMDLLKANYEVTEKDGFITAIDGQEQDEKEGIYWMFDLNGELAPKAADQIELNDGDTVEFYQKKF
ncbi:DUF4430 domain-containing protein [Streptococcus porci]|uniref:DUF4430 domain-containing protein n=1 Tax=Streptococcus porci TaxID=502567 RepID=UPI0003FA08AC|nr:DUF4430 domain-containing protein [Streptococcus porci]